MSAVATPRGLVPAGPIRDLIEQWCKREVDARNILGPLAGVCLGNTAKVAELTGLSVELIKAIRSGERKGVEFDNADKIVITLASWDENAELYAIFQDFDLSVLDRKRPSL